MLEARARAFLDAWNAGDLELAMGFMAEAATYEDASGAVHQGKDAVRAAFTPTFDGSSGAVCFALEELAAGPSSVTLTWTCELSSAGGRRRWRGVDLLTFDEAGLILRKLTYAKARLIRLQPAP